jgi:hypothetical protein
MPMNRNLQWQLGIAAVSLSAAVAVYSFARAYPPALLEPLQATRSALAASPGLFGSLPSLFFTLAVGLLLGACAATPAGARLHCSLWTGLALLLELTQHPLLAVPASGLLPAILPEPIWEVIGPYWLRGSFDPLDLLATVAGGSIALAVLVKTRKDKENETPR